MAEGSCRCGTRWTGRRTAHCARCHATFGGVSGFDLHRRARDASCLDAAALVEAGFHRDERGTWRQAPAEEPHWIAVT